MALRNLLRYLGLMMILATYIGSGIQKVTNPKASAVLLAKSYFPYYLSLTGVQLTPEQYQQVIQAVGIAFIAFSLLILLGVGRSFFAFLMAIGTIGITVCFFVDPQDPLGADEETQIRIMSNLAITGGLLFVSGSGIRSRQYSEAKAKAAEGRNSNGNHQKKNN